MQFTSLRLLTGMILASVLIICPRIAKGQHFHRLDYATPSLLEFNQPEYPLTDDQTNAVITILRNGDFRQRTTVRFATGQGTAVPGVDYAPTNGTVVFPAGQSRVNITIPVSAKNNAEERTIALNLSEPGADTVITRPSAQIVIPARANVASTQGYAGLKVESGGGGQLLLSWPAAYTNCVLEFSTSLTGGDWAKVTLDPSVAADRCKVKQSMASQVGFYRLRKL